MTFSSYGAAPMED